MKSFLCIFLISFLIEDYQANSQNTNLPDVDLFTKDNIKINTSDLCFSDTILILFIWESKSPQGFNQLLEINELCQDWLQNKNVKVIGICTDVSGNPFGIIPKIAAYNIEFDIYFDINNSLKRAMSIPHEPFLFITGCNAEDIRFMSCYCNIKETITKIINDHPALVAVNK